MLPNNYSKFVRSFKISQNEHSQLKTSFSLKNSKIDILRIEFNKIFHRYFPAQTNNLVTKTYITPQAKKITTSTPDSFTGIISRDQNLREKKTRNKQKCFLYLLRNSLDSGNSTQFMTFASQQIVIINRSLVKIIYKRARI
jgi:hypothetical protein